MSTGLITGQIIAKTQKMVLSASLFSALYFKVRSKGKVEQFREKGNALPIQICLETIEKRSFGLPSNTVANFTLSIFL